MSVGEAEHVTDVLEHHVLESAAGAEERDIAPHGRGGSRRAHLRGCGMGSRGRSRERQRHRGHADLGSRRRRSASTRRQRSRRGGRGGRRKRRSPGASRCPAGSPRPPRCALARQQSSRPARCRERRASTRTIRHRGAGVGWRPGDRPQRPDRTAPSRGPQAWHDAHQPLAGLARTTTPSARAGGLRRCRPRLWWRRRAGVPWQVPARPRRPPSGRRFGARDR